jgi:hypothetical protein
MKTSKIPKISTESPDVAMAVASAAENKMPNCATEIEQEIIPFERNTKLFHVEDFDLKTDCRIGKVKPGKYSIVPVENAYTSKIVKIQIDGGGTCPPFVYDTASQYGNSIVINVEDSVEKKALTKIQDDLATLAIENRDTWLPGSTLSESQIREKGGKILFYSKADKGKEFPPTIKMSADEADLVPQINKMTKKMNKFADLKIVDENNQSVALDQLAGRKWNTCIFSIACIFIPATGNFNFKKTLNYLAVGEASAFSVSSTARELLTYDFARDGIIGSKLIAKDRYNLVDFSNKDDGSKIVLRFSNGGRLPPFATDVSQFGASNLNFEIDNEEKNALVDFQKVLLAHVLKHRSTFLPTFLGGDDAIIRGDMLEPKIFAEGKPKKDQEGQFWSHSAKCSFDEKEVNGPTNKVLIVDANGQDVAIADLPRRTYNYVDVQFSCCYLQQGKKLGVSRKLVKLVVSVQDEDEGELAPIVKNDSVRPAKRQRM